VSARSAGGDPKRVSLPALVVCHGDASYGHQRAGAAPGRAGPRRPRRSRRVANAASVPHRSARPSSTSRPPRREPPRCRASCSAQRRIRQPLLACATRLPSRAANRPPLGRAVAPAAVHHAPSASTGPYPRSCRARSAPAGRSSCSSRPAPAASGRPAAHCSCRAASPRRRRAPEPERVRTPLRRLQREQRASHVHLDEPRIPSRRAIGGGGSVPRAIARMYRGPRGRGRRGERRSRILPAEAARNVSPPATALATDLGGAHDAPFRATPSGGSGCASAARRGDPSAASVSRRRGRRRPR